MFSPKGLSKIKAILGLSKVHHILGVHLDQILTLKTNITLLPSHSKNLSLFFSSKTK
jgi:hypothetical protein